MGPFWSFMHLRFKLENLTVSHKVCASHEFTSPMYWWALRSYSLEDEKLSVITSFHDFNNKFCCISNFKFSGCNCLYFVQSSELKIFLFLINKLNIQNFFTWKYKRDFTIFLSHENMKCVDFYTFPIKSVDYYTFPGDHSFSKYAKSSEKLTFLALWLTHGCVSGGKKC